MNRLTEIAKDLGILYAARETLALREWQLKEDIEARKVFLTPAEGWPGKNEEQRRIEAQRVFAADEPIQEMITALAQLKEDQSIDNGDILSLEAERRALEWSIRERLADALAGKRENHHDVAETAFDDAMQVETDSQVQAELAYLLAENEGDQINPGEVNLDEIDVEITDRMAFDRDIPF